MGNTEFIYEKKDENMKSVFLGFQQKKPALLIPVFGLGQAQSGGRISLPFGSVCRGKIFQQILHCRFPMR